MNLTSTPPQPNILQYWNYLNQYPVDRHNETIAKVAFDLESTLASAGKHAEIDRLVQAKKSAVNLTTKTLIWSFSLPAIFMIWNVFCVLTGRPTLFLSPLLFPIFLAYAWLFYGLCNWLRAFLLHRAIAQAESHMTQC